MTENEIKLDQAKFYGQQGYVLILERDKTIIFLVQLIIALLAIATFSENIIPENLLSVIKILLIFLLFITPVMIWDYILKINDGINSVLKILEFKNNPEKWYKSLIGGSVYVYITLVSIIIDIIASLILQNLLAIIIALSTQILIIILLVCVSKKHFNKNK